MSIQNQWCIAEKLEFSDKVQSALRLYFNWDVGAGVYFTTPRAQEEIGRTYLVHLKWCSQAQNNEILKPRDKGSRRAAMEKKQWFQTFTQLTLGQSEGGNSFHSSTKLDLGRTCSTDCWVARHNKTLVHPLYRSPTLTEKQKLIEFEMYHPQKTTTPKNSFVCFLFISNKNL